MTGLTGDQWCVSKHHTLCRTIFPYVCRKRIYEDLEHSWSHQKASEGGARRVAGAREQYPLSQVFFLPWDDCERAVSRNFALWLCVCTRRHTVSAGLFRRWGCLAPRQAPARETIALDYI